MGWYSQADKPSLHCRGVVGQASSGTVITRPGVGKASVPAITCLVTHQRCDAAVFGRTSDAGEAT